MYNYILLLIIIFCIILFHKKIYLLSYHYLIKKNKRINSSYNDTIQKVNKFTMVDDYHLNELTNIVKEINDDNIDGSIVECVDEVNVPMGRDLYFFGS